MLQQKMSVYIATKRRVMLPEEDFLQAEYLDITNKKKLLQTLQKNKKVTWIISDSLSIIEIADSAQYKAIFLANGAEKDWEITPIFSFIAASMEQIGNFFYLIHDIN